MAILIVTSPAVPTPSLWRWRATFSSCLTSTSWARSSWSPPRWRWEARSGQNVASQVSQDGEGGEGGEDGEDGNDGNGDRVDGGEVGEYDLSVHVEVTPWTLRHSCWPLARPWRR